MMNSATQAPKTNKKSSHQLNIPQKPANQRKNSQYIIRGDARRQNFDSKPEFVQYGLYYSKQYNHARKQAPSVQLFISENLKAVGNRKYKSEKFREACVFYYQALAIFIFVVSSILDFETQGEFEHILQLRELTVVGVDDTGLEYVNKLDWFMREDEKFGKSLRQLILSLYLNIAACYLKEKKFLDCLAVCNEALILDPENPKA